MSKYHDKLAAQAQLRRRAILRMIAAGKTLDQIGEKLKISHQRVAQLAKEGREKDKVVMPPGRRKKLVSQIAALSAADFEALVADANVALLSRQTTVAPGGYMDTGE